MWLSIRWSSWNLFSLHSVHWYHVQLLCDSWLQTFTWNNGLQFLNIYQYYAFILIFFNNKKSTNIKETSFLPPVLSRLISLSCCYAVITMCPTDVRLVKVLLQVSLFYYFLVDMFLHITKLFWCLSILQTPYLQTLPLSMMKSSIWLRLFCVLIWCFFVILSIVRPLKIKQRF